MIVSGAADIRRGQWARAARRARDTRIPWVGLPYLVAGIMLLGGVLRLYRADALSLWVDEGLTVLFTRLPWPTLLGVGPAYSLHPPLYFALVKLLSLVCPELLAGRLLSVAASILTIPVLYLLGARLVGLRAGLLAALVLALAPVHIWYAREARPYALVALLIALCYLALVIVLEGGRRAWVAVYTGAAVAALYTEDSAVFALAPQVLVLAYAALRGLPRARVLALAYVVAGSAFIPWLPRLLAETGTAGVTDQFALSPGRVAAVVLSVVGLSADQAVFQGGWLPPWVQWPAAHPLVLAPLIAVAVLGVVALARRPLALVVTLALGPGTLVAALLVSLVDPSLAERTVLSSVLGWALLAGAAPLAWPTGSRLRGAGAVTLALALALSTATQGAVDADAYKQEWRDLAAATADAGRLGWPVVTYPTVAGVLLDLYQPRLVGRGQVSLDDKDDVSAIAAGNATRDGAVWVSYIAGARTADLDRALTARGDARLIHQYYPYPLYLDLYVARHVPLGRALPLDGRRAGDDHGAGASEWIVPSHGASLAPDGRSGQRLRLGSDQAVEGAARLDRPAASAHLYTLDAHVRSDGGQGVERVFLECLAADTSFLTVAPDAGGAIVAGDGHWHTLTIGIFCPAATQTLRIDVRHDGAGTTDFGVVRVWDKSPRP